MTMILVRILVAAAFVLGLNAAAQAQEQLRLELQEILILPEGGAPGVVQVQSGTIVVRTSDVSIDYQWTPPPQVIGPEGVSMTLTAQATRLAGESWVGIGVMGPGFILDPQNPGVNFWAEHQGSSNTAYVLIKPDPNLRPGDTAAISVGVTPETNVVYHYRVAGGAPPQGALNVTHDCPADIVISALPSVNCHLIITGFRRNTADPVEVIFPAELDTFGNHANGIQLQGRGSQDVFNWDQSYSWGLFVFACPGQGGTGANCYGNVTTPGPVSVPIIVRQKGLADVTVTLTFNATGGGDPRGPGARARIIDGIDFGDDQSRFALDGECDDPRFEGPGMTTTGFLSEDAMHDATDCANAYLAGLIWLVGQGGSIGDMGLLQVSNDCPTAIEISALPSVNCHLIISGFRRNTADPVEVIFPDEIDTFGNHANGIQLQGRGSQDVYSWGDSYSWGLFIFACPSQANTGANCYDSVTSPGASSTTIIVRQKGSLGAIIRLPLFAVPHGSGGGNNSGGLIIDGIDFGDDASRWARDNECDDPRFEGPGMTTTPLLPEDTGHDASDCAAAYRAGNLRLR